MKRRFVAFVIALMLVLPNTNVSFGQSAATTDSKVLHLDGTVRSLTVPNGMGQLVAVPVACDTVSIGDPQVCDIVMVGEKEFLLLGKKPGQTNIYVWLADGSKLESTIKVHDDTEILQKLIERILPYEDAITISIAHNTVILSGYVKKHVSIENAQKIAEAYMAGRESASSIQIKVVNMLKTLEDQQILLEVRLAEVARSAAKDMGIDWRFEGDLFGNYSDLSWLDGGTPAYNGANEAMMTIPASNGGQGTSAGGMTFKDGQQVRQVAYGLDFLESKGLAKVIAKPNLLVRDGEEASFLAGGEFPVPIQQEDSVQIEWKEFGVRLKFTPKLDERDNIELVLAPEVSVLDSTAGVTVGGTSVPALKTRKTETKVILRDGESYYIAGLISQSESDTFSQMPGISNVPILGNLFKKKEGTKSETELIVFVTPRIVKAAPKTVDKDFSATEKINQMANTQPVPFEQAHGDAIKEFIEQGEKPAKSLEELREEEMKKELEKIGREQEKAPIKPEAATVRPAAETVTEIEADGTRGQVTESTDKAAVVVNKKEKYEERFIGERETYEMTTVKAKKKSHFKQWRQKRKERAIAERAEHRARAEQLKKDKAERRQKRIEEKAKDKEQKQQKKLEKKRKHDEKKVARAQAGKKRSWLKRMFGVK